MDKVQKEKYVHCQLKQGDLLMMQYVPSHQARAGNVIHGWQINKVYPESILEYSNTREKLN